jgi:hypothetical protein
MAKLWSLIALESHFSLNRAIMSCGRLKAYASAIQKFTYTYSLLSYSSSTVSHSTNAGFGAKREMPPLEF